MFSAADHPTRVPFDGSFQLSARSTAPAKGQVRGKAAKKALSDQVDAIATLQRRLFAEDRKSLLLVFQAMDAAGKDSTIRAVTSGVNPAGFQVFGFGVPSKLELDHDFLWRTACRLPERGRIGVFNRSYYEEVLVVRVHPEYLDGQRLPDRPDLDTLWDQRLESIADHEKHLARNGTVILKFFLNVGQDEQARRLLDRIDEPDKNWKFNPVDVQERAHWSAYMDAYQHALNRTSTPWAPWFCVPADDKPAMRLQVAQIVRTTLEQMEPQAPQADPDDVAEMAALRQVLLDQLAANGATR